MKKTKDNHVVIGYLEGMELYISENIPKEQLDRLSKELVEAAKNSYKHEED